MSQHDDLMDSDEDDEGQDDASQRQRQTQTQTQAQHDQSQRGDHRAKKRARTGGKQVPTLVIF